MKPVSQMFCEGVLLVLTSSAAGQGLAPNLVQNGSFEALGKNYDLPPWHNGSGGRAAIDIVVAEPWRTPDGSNFVVSKSYVCQDVRTVSGQPYLFRFAYGGYERAQFNTGPLHVSWGEQNVITFPIPPTEWMFPGWHYFDFVVVAQSNTTRVAFSTRGKESFPYIDDVQVTALPSQWVALPQSLTAEEGSAAFFRLSTVNLIQGSSYQWLFGGTNALSGATNTTLRVTNLHPAHAGLYSVVMSNSLLTVTSAPARLSIVPRVEKRTVPVLWAGVLANFTRLQFECADGPDLRWVPLVNVVQTNGHVFFVDRTPSLPDLRLYRVSGDSRYTPLLAITSTIGICLSGSVGATLQIDYLNAIGPADTWQPLDTVTLTSPIQIYSSDAMLGKTGKLYRVVPLP